MKQIWLEKDGTLQVLTDESLDDVKRVLVTQKGSLYGGLFYSDELRAKGRWISGKCSECGEHAPFWSMASTYYKSNFCPNCGAEMKEEL